MMGSDSRTVMVNFILTGDTITLFYSANNYLAQSRLVLEPCTHEEQGAVRFDNLYPRQHRIVVICLSAFHSVPCVS